MPLWVTSLASAGAAVGLMYRVVAETIDGAAGLIAAIMLLGTRELRLQSLMVLANPVALVLGLLMILAWLRWRKQQKLEWAFFIGALAGWMAITRPPDALCFAIPIGCAVLVDLRRRGLQNGSAAMKRLVATASVIVLGAAPFLLIQLIFNRGVTGSLVQTPHQYYGKIF